MDHFMFQINRVVYEERARAAQAHDEANDSARKGRVAHLISLGKEWLGASEEKGS